MTAGCPIGTRTRQLITRSASINESRRYTGTYRPVDGSVITATDISFTSPGTIASAGSAFGNIAAGSNIEITGSPLNSRVYLVETASAASITVSPALLTTESAGATIQVIKV